MVVWKFLVEIQTLVTGSLQLLLTFGLTEREILRSLARSWRSYFVVAEGLLVKVRNFMVLIVVKMLLRTTKIFFLRHQLRVNVIHINFSMEKFALTGQINRIMEFRSKVSRIKIICLSIIVCLVKPFSHQRWIGFLMFQTSAWKLVMIRWLKKVRNGLLPFKIIIQQHIFARKVLPEFSKIYVLPSVIFDIFILLNWLNFLIAGMNLPLS